MVKSSCIVIIYLYCYSIDSRTKADFGNSIDTIANKTWEYIKSRAHYKKLQANHVMRQMQEAVVEAPKQQTVWKDMRDWFVSVWAKITDGATWAKVKDAFNWEKFQSTMKTSLENTKTNLDKFGENTKEWFVTMWANITSKQFWDTKWEEFTQSCKTAGTKTSDAFSTGWADTKQWFETMAENVRSKSYWDDKWGGFKQSCKSTGDSLGYAWNDVSQWFQTMGSNIASKSFWSDKWGAFTDSCKRSSEKIKDWFSNAGKSIKDFWDIKLVGQS